MKKRNLLLNLTFVLFIFLNGCALKNNTHKTINKKRVIKKETIKNNVKSNKLIIPYTIIEIKNKKYILLNKYYIVNYLKYIKSVKKLKLYICTYEHLYPYFLFNNKKTFYDGIQNKCFIIKNDKILKYLKSPYNKLIIISDKFKKRKGLKILLIIF